MADDRQIDAHIANAANSAEQSDWQNALISINEALLLDATSKAAHLANIELVGAMPQLIDANHRQSLLQRARLSIDLLTASYPDDAAVRGAIANVELMSNPDPIEWFIRQARNLASRGRWTDAISSINTALEVDPTSKSTHLVHIEIINDIPELTHVSYRSTLLSRAKQSGATLVFAHPDDPEAHEAKARVHLMAKENARALESAEAALKIDPSYEAAYQIVEQTQGKLSKRLNKMSIHKKSRW